MIYTSRRTLSTNPTRNYAHAAQMCIPQMFIDVSRRHENNIVIHSGCRLARGVGVVCMFATDRFLRWVFYVCVGLTTAVASVSMLYTLRECVKYDVLPCSYIHDERGGLWLGSMNILYCVAATVVTIAKCQKSEDAFKFAYLAYKYNAKNDYIRYFCFSYGCIVYIVYINIHRTR